MYLQIVMAALEPGARRSGKHLRYDRYVYQHNKALSNKHSWRCRVVHCRARLWTNLFDRNSANPTINIIHTTDHDPGTDDRVIARASVLAAARDQFQQDPTKRLRKTYDELIAERSRQGFNPRYEPEFDSVESASYRMRKALVPPIPHNMESVQIEGQWARKWTNEK